MTKEEALKVLVKMRAWRRWGKGEQNEKDMPEMPEPKEVDEAFDVFIETLSQLSPPSLPSNLDEAAEEYEHNLGYYECVNQWPSVAFKAGAEWMAGQGETHEAEIIESVPFGGTKWRRCIKVWLDDQFQAKGDKVVVQIRKKQ